MVDPVGDRVCILHDGRTGGMVTIRGEHIDDRKEDDEAQRFIEG